MSDPTQNNDPTSTPKRPFRWGRVVLVVSLALNLAVVGLIAGAAFRGGHAGDNVEDRARALQTRDFGFGPYIAAFSGPERRKVGRAFLKQAGNPNQVRREVEASFEAVVSALKAEPFDGEAFKALVLKQQSALAQRQVIGATVLAEQLAQMSAEERTAYAEKLDRVLRRPKPRDDAR